jgi:hypothetical protein
MPHTCLDPAVGQASWTSSASQLRRPRQHCSMDHIPMSTVRIVSANAYTDGNTIASTREVPNPSANAVSAMPRGRTCSAARRFTPRTQRPPRLQGENRGSESGVVPSSWRSWRTLRDRRPASRQESERRAGLQLAVRGAGDHFVLQRTVESVEVVAVAGDAHDQVSILLGMLLRAP